MKKEKRDCKIEFMHDDVGHEFRYYWYRIVPSELPFFKRIFKNPWYCAYKFSEFAVDGEYRSYLFTIDDYYKYIAPLKTYGDAVSFINSQHKRAEQYRSEMIAKRRIWPN